MLALAALPAPAWAVAPADPTGVTAVAGKRTIAVSWTHPGTNVNHFVATAGSKTCSASGSARGCTISALTANTAYTVTVKACSTASNSADCSVGAAALSPATPGPPNSPTKPAVSYTGNGGEVKVIWAPGTGGTAGIDSFTVTPSPSVDALTGTCTAPLGPNATECVAGGLTPGESYTFRVVAAGMGLTGSSVASTASNAIVAGPPGQPAPPAVTRGDNDDEVVVSWTEPTGGAPATSYTVTSDLPANVTGLGDCGTTGSSRSCVVVVDDPTLEYTFQVAANGGGTSEASEPSLSITPGKPGIPGTPTVDLTGEGTATVTWEAPADGSPVDHYTVASDPETDDPPDCGADLGALTCDFIDLDPAQTYTFTVTAVSAVGVETTSAESIEVVAAPPGAPGRPELTVTASGAVTVIWAAPEGGGPVNGYAVIAEPSVTISDTCGEDVGDRSCHLTGLDPAVAYTFVVGAVGPAGYAESVASLPVTPGAPGTPGTPSVALGTAPGEVTVSWTAPSEGGPVDSYTLTSNRPITVPNGCTTLRSCTLTNLDSALSYTFTVTATGPVSPAAVSATSAGVLPDKPGVPGTPSVVVGNAPGKATVEWTAPTSGGVVTSYTLESNRPITVPNGCTVAKSCSFTDLNPSLAYQFRVVAVGDSGSAPSEWSSPMVKPDMPAAPLAPTVTLGATPGTATVEWAVPASGGPVTGYSLTSNQPITVPNGCTTARSCVFTNLDPALSYTFRVEAVGPAGAQLSPASSPAVKPDKPGVPGTPSVLLGNAPGKATVSWTAPASGGPVTAYNLTSNQPITVPNGCAATRSCVFTDLVPTLSYTFRVEAVGPSGAELSAASSAAVTPDRPGAPGKPTVTNGVPGSVTIAWTVPQTGGPVLTYSVASLPERTPPAGCADTAAAQTCVFSGLDPAESYTFQVTAIGASGTRVSPRSDAVSPGAPGAPGTPVVAVAAANTVRVSWTASPSSGGIVTGYAVTSDPVVAPSEGCVLTTALTCDFSGLDATRSYTFLVTAIGGAGRTPSVARSVPITPAAAGVPGTATVRVVSAGTVRVSWTAPAGGGPIDDYTVTATPDGGSPEPGCTVTALTCDVAGLDATKTYTFLVTANGKAGNTSAAEQSASVSLAAPAAPAAPAVQLAGPHSVRVSWEAPVGGGAAARYSVVSDPVVLPPAECTDVTALACVFENLDSGVRYTFRVVATGPVGGPVTGAASAPIIPGPPDMPGRPTVALTSVTNQVRVSWEVPSEGAGIQGYTVQSNPGRLGCDAPATGVAISCVVSNLVPTQAYTFRVQAVGVGFSGNSGFSPQSAAITPGALSAPTDVDVARADRQIAVSWTAPANAANRVAYYRATVNQGGAGCRTADGTTTDCVITGLTNLTAYTVQVVAVGVEGTADSSPSAPSVRVRPTAGLPGAPTSVTGTPGDHSVLVTWAAPASTGDGVAHYVATASGTPDGQTCVSPDAATLSCLITGLTNGTGYRLTVVAVGRAASGISVPSTPSAVVTPDAPPATPTGVTVTPGTADLTVRFTPGEGGTAAVNFTATAAGGLSGGPCTTANATTFSCVITGVQAGGSYTVTVVANSAKPNLRSAASAPTSAVTASAFAAPTLPGTVPTGTTAVMGPLASSAGAALTVGGTTTLSGDGFAPYAGIVIGSYGSASVLTTVVADSKGAFSVPVTITGATGPRTLVAGGRTPATTPTIRYRSLPVTVTPGTVAAVAAR